MIDVLTSPRMVRALQFGGVSFGSIVLTQVLLAALQAGGMVPAVANAVAVTLAAVPTFLISRRWVWGFEGPHRRARQATMFWLTAIAGLLLSTALVGALVPPGAPILYANALNLSAFGSVWVLKYLFLDTVVFSPGSRA
jgi:putative flippase GtrA